MTARVQQLAPVAPPHLRKECRSTAVVPSAYPRRFSSGSRRQQIAQRHRLIMAVQPAAAEGTAFKEDKLSFLNAKGERLVGRLVDTGSPEVVILCHGYVANMQFCQFPQLAAGLAEAGISSFRFDHACAIYSESERKGPFLMGNHDDEVADMAAAVEFMAARGKRVLCLLGHSKGGINVVLYGARHCGGAGGGSSGALALPKLVNLSGRFCTRDGVLQRFGADILERLAAAGPGGIPRKEPFGLEWVMTEEDFRGRADLDMEGAAKAIPPSVQVLVLHGTGDTTIPFQEAEECAALVPNVRLQLIEGADHNFTRPEHAQKMVEAVVAFVKEG